ncbi:uncharacterized protein PV09_03673 [Verruconis gallopava]|uniref:Uncharacterized protein n=1 Tax=Verruconis gallopava TaxID=253628 RepID=A0A0D1YWP4_9PEZI|nr:uncharacterized protein PV09_03673 [Verruconis gallopava]KIW05117.1 hypothetical protein PV09_03673 [Verruconis gallopava]
MDMVSGEGSKRDREDERTGYDEKASSTPSPAKHCPKSQENSESSGVSSASEPELKPKPLFSGRQAVCVPLTRSANAESFSEWSMASSRNMSSSATTMTAMTSGASTAKIHDFKLTGQADCHYHTVRPFPAPGVFLRESVEHIVFPPGYSSLAAKPTVVDTPRQRIPVLVNTERFADTLNQGKHHRQHWMKEGNGTLAHSEPTAVLYTIKTSTQQTFDGFSSKQSEPPMPLSKIWTPPPYKPPETRKPQNVRRNLLPNYTCVQCNTGAYQAESGSVHKSTLSTSPNPMRIRDDSSQFTKEQETRKDSFSLASTPKRSNSSRSLPSPKQGLITTLTQSTNSPSCQNVSATSAEYEQSAAAAEDRLKRFRFVDNAEPVPRRIDTFAVHPVFREEGSSHAKLAGPELLEHDYYYTCNEESRGNLTYTHPDLPNWLNSFSPPRQELIIDPNGFLSGPPRPYYSRIPRARSNTDMATPATRNVCTKRSHVDTLISPQMVRTTGQANSERLLPRQRYGPKMERAPPKAMRVLGPYDAAVDVELKEEKHQKREKTKRKIEGVLEAVSSALELG